MGKLVELTWSQNILVYLSLFLTYFHLKQPLPSSSLNLVLSLHGVMMPQAVIQVLLLACALRDHD